MCAHAGQVIAEQLFTAFRRDVELAPKINSVQYVKRKKKCPHIKAEMSILRTEEAVVIVVQCQSTYCVIDT